MEKHIEEENCGKDNGLPPAGQQSANHEHLYLEEIDHLRLFVPRVFQLFHWFGADSYDQQLCTVEYLGNMLCWSLTSIRRLLSLRSQYLCDEHCRDFEAMLIGINSIIISIERFVERADDLFQHEADQQPRLQQLADRCRDDVTWLTTRSRDEQLMSLVQQKCEQMNFLLNTRMLMLPAIGFRQMAYAVMFGLMLLTLPSHGQADHATIARLYRNSLRDYADSIEGSQELAEFNERMDEELSINPSSSAKEEINYLTKRKISKRTQIKNMLAQFGISYNITNNESSVARFAANLYASLNGGEHAQRKMTDADLAHYFLLETKLTYLKQRIGRLQAVFDGAPSPPDPTGFFKASVKRNRVYKAISDTLHERKGDHCHVMEAQAHWLAVFRVLEESGLSQGTMKQFADTMNTEKWFPNSEPPCNYKSMKAVPAIDVKTKHFKQWDPKHDRRNAPYKLVADTLVKHLEEQDLL